MLLNQRVVGATDALHDQGHGKQDNSWQLQQWEGLVLMFIPLLLLCKRLYSRNSEQTAHSCYCTEDDLVIKAEYMEELLVELNAWKYWKEKCLHVNIRYEVI